MSDFERMMALLFVKQYSKAFLKNVGIEGWELQFICEHCAKGEHEECPTIAGDVTWCDCQHKGTVLEK